MSAGHFLKNLFEETESKAKESQDKFDKERQSDIDMYRKVMLDPSSSPEQRTKAAGEIEKLRNIKGKEGPFKGLANVLNLVKSHHGKLQDGKMQKPPLPGMPENDKSSQEASQKPTAEQPGQPQSKMAPPPSSVGGAKMNLAHRALDKVGKGLGAVAGVADRAITGQGPGQKLPPLNADVFKGQTAAEQQKQTHVNTLKQADQDYFEVTGKHLTENEAAQFMKIMPKPGAFTKKATVVGESIPPDSKDAFGHPVIPGAPYDVLENVQGELQYFPSMGKPDSDTQRVTQQWVYNPDKQEFELKPVASSSKTTHSYPNMAKPLGASRGMKPPPGQTKGQERSTGQPGAIKGYPGASSTGGKTIPIRAFGTLQKQANAINEASNSLIGDTPGEVGGLAKDIDLFKNPSSVKRISEYIKFTNQQLLEQSKQAPGSGPMAAAEWYLGLPQAISNLESGALRQYSQTLDNGASDGPERQFVSDYYRWLGTWGGMRAATGASPSARSVSTLVAEGFTPGPTTTYPEAVSRVKNMAREANVVAQNNPMVKKIDVDGIFKDKSSPKLDNNSVKILKKHGVYVE